MSKRFVVPTFIGPWCIVFLISLIGLLGGLAYAQTKPQVDLSGKNVLILHSDLGNIPLFLDTDKGISAALESGGISRVNQFFESLMLVQYPGPEHRKLLVEQMRLRYGHRKPDMIVTMYPEALEFALKDCRGVFPDAPILALYLLPNSADPKTDHWVIKHFVEPDVLGTLEIALKLVPGAKRVYVVSGTHKVDKWIENQARLASKKWERVEFVYLSQMPFEDVLATVSSAPSHSIILGLVISHDPTGKIQTHPEMIRRLNRVSTAPIFGTLGVALGHGIVGGSLADYELIGTRAGQLALDILRGAGTPENIPTPLSIPPVPMFDWRELKRWKLSETALPKGSIVMNREVTLWDFKYYIIGGVVFCLAETGLIIILIAQRRRRRSAELILRQNENDLRTLAGRLIYAQEDERRRIARELHDDLAQRLAVFAIDVADLKKQFMDPPAPAQEKLREMEKDIGKISQDVHSLSRQLHPSILDDLGLIKAVESECKNFSRREGIEIVFKHENISTGIRQDVSLSLYRIIQEGLRNISKHACAEHIFVSLKGIDRDVLLSVQDDGIGFDWAEVQKQPGLGFSSMRERARLIRGNLSIQSQPEKGTAITLRVPLMKEGE